MLAPLTIFSDIEVNEKADALHCEVKYTKHSSFVNKNHKK